MQQPRDGDTESSQATRSSLPLLLQPVSSDSTTQIIEGRPMRGHGVGRLGNLWPSVVALHNNVKRGWWSYTAAGWVVDRRCGRFPARGADARGPLKSRQAP